MGLFGFKNKRDICPKEKNLRGIVSNHMVGGIIKINAMLKVPNGYIAIIGKKGKVADKFESGEHFFNFSNLPLMCRKFKIDKEKKGKKQDEFIADLYFVSKDLFEGSFKTYRKVMMGTKAYGFYKTHVFGTYVYRVSDVREFMQSLLNEFDYIKTNEAENIVEGWVNEVIVQELERQNFILQDVLNNTQLIADVLKNRISKLFSVAGLELVDIKITNVKVPKKYLAQQNLKEGLTKENLEQNNENKENVKEGEEKNTPQDVDDGVDEQSFDFKNETETVINKQLESEQLISINDQDQEHNKDKENQEYVPFGNMQIKQTNLQEIKMEETKEKTFVDLSTNEVYNDSAKNTKMCINCGAENHEDATHCLLCGERFNNDSL